MGLNALQQIALTGYGQPPAQLLRAKEEVGQDQQHIQHLHHKTVAMTLMRMVTTNLATMMLAEWKSEHQDQHQGQHQGQHQRQHQRRHQGHHQVPMPFRANNPQM